MHALEKRIAILEQASPQADTVVFIILVGMGEADKHRELVHIYDNHDNHWHRGPNETEQEFKDRATAETPRKGNNVALLFGESSFNA
jgi:hypothetical protein